MTVTNLNWRDALNAVRGARRCANPNFGFQRQLLQFQHERLEQERERLFTKFNSQKPPYDDVAECKVLLEIHHNWVINGDEESREKEAEDALYPLPLGAYGKGQKSSPEDKEAQTEAATADVSNSAALSSQNTTTSIPTQAETSTAEKLGDCHNVAELVSEVREMFGQNPSQPESAESNHSPGKDFTLDPTKSKSSTSEDNSLVRPETESESALPEDSQPSNSAEKTIEDMFNNSNVR